MFPNQHKIPGKVTKIKETKRKKRIKSEVDTKSHNIFLICLLLMLSDFFFFKLKEKCRKNKNERIRLETTSRKIIIFFLFYFFFFDFTVFIEIKKRDEQCDTKRLHLNYSEVFVYCCWSLYLYIRLPLLLFRMPQ